MEGRKITREGKEALKKKFEHLQNERVSILTRLEYARAFGDLKENAEYQEAKDSLRKLDSDLSELQIILSSCIVVENNNSDVVQFGSKVTLENVETNEKQIFTIVGDAESDISEGLLSEIAPLAKIMLGKKVGEIFLTIKGDKNFKIIDIK